MSNKKKKSYIIVLKYKAMQLQMKEKKDACNEAVKTNVL